MKIGIVAWLETDDAHYGTPGSDPEAWAWLINDILLGQGPHSEPITLHSSEVGDTVGTLKISSVGLWNSLPMP